MTKLLVLPETLFDAWELYLEYLEVNNLDIASLAQTALFRYTLPGYGLPEKVTKSEILDFMRKVPLAQFVDALNVQQNVFDFLETKKYSQRSNRHRLKQMLDWCSAQDWWKMAAQGKQYAPRRRNNLGNAHHVKLINRTKHQRFSLKNIRPEHLSDIWKQINPDILLDNLDDEIEQFKETKERIQKEIKQLRRFQVSIQFRKRQNKAMREVTADKIEQQIYLILGWLYFYERQPLRNLGLHCFDNIDLAYDYTNWQQEKNLSPKTEQQALITILNVAKFLHYQKSDQKHCEALAKPYSDIEIIGELRKLIRDTNQRIKEAAITMSDESQKWLSWPKYLACVEYLKKDCALLTSDGQPRTERAIARSYERYLIAALLAYMPPDRQRTFRELQEGKTLVRGVIKNGIFCPSPDGLFHIKLEPSDYKTGQFYGRSVLPVPECLHPELEAWLNHWRLVLKPNHPFVFTQLNGKPLIIESLYHLFRHAIYRASVVLFGEGRATNPHLVRDMLVTYMYEMEASEAVMDGLALGMKHSRETQKKSYDRRSLGQKVEPALKAIQQLKPVEIPKSKLKVVQPVSID